MAKKSKKRSAAAGKKNAAELFVDMQKKGKRWYEKECKGIALIEGFQSALAALRAAQQTVDHVDDNELTGLAGNLEMDPWLAEDLYQQLQELPTGFEELLQEMYTLQAQAAEIVRTADEDAPSDAMRLASIDYLQMINQELTTFENEYQHVEALLKLISFETTTDELRTLVISWTTSPFLEPAQSRAFFQRHQLSQTSS